MKKQIFFLLTLLYTNTNASNWELVWSDEFEEPGFPDELKWSFDVQGNQWNWGNNEDQNYTPKENRNAWVENGNLIIEARKEDYVWPGDGELKHYTSARLITKNKGDWKYCKVEVKALLPTGRGMWPAIWMLPTDEVYGGWPKSGELDIMENVGYENNYIHCNIHTEAYNHSIGTNKGGSLIIPENELPSQQWHVYSMEWKEDNVTFFVDDKKVFSFNKEANNYSVWPFDQKFHLLLNVAVGGGWGGTKGIDDSCFPQRMLVDYVRVYKEAETTTLLEETFPDISVYPSVTKDYITIKSQDKISSATLISANGSVSSLIIDDNNIVSLQGFNIGAYTLILNKKQTFKIIKK